VQAPPGKRSSRKQRPHSRKPLKADTDPRVTTHVHRCSKTTLLDVLSRFVLLPLPTANVTAAAIFGVVESHRPTLLVDKADKFLPEAEELRGWLKFRRRGLVS